MRVSSHHAVTQYVERRSSCQALDASGGAAQHGN
jgi:hypothetical protein